MVVCIGWRRAADSRADPKIAAGARWPPPPFPGEHKKRSDLVSLTLKRRLPTLPRDNRSTIGVSELNFSVRNGKRWNLTAITT